MASIARSWLVRLGVPVVVSSLAVVWIGFWFRSSFRLWVAPVIPLGFAIGGPYSLVQLPFTVGVVLAVYAVPGLLLFWAMKKLIVLLVDGTIPHRAPVRSDFTFDGVRIDYYGLLALGLSSATAFVVSRTAFFGLGVIWPLALELLVVFAIMLSGGVEVAVLVRVARLLPRLGTSDDAVDSPRGIDRVVVPVATAVGLLRTQVSAAGEVPDRGTVAVSGTVDGAPEHGTFQSPGGTDCVLCYYRVEAVDRDADGAAPRGGDDGSGPVLVEGVESTPFAVDTGDGGVVVDPTPWDPDERLVPERSGRPPADYRTSTIRWPGTDTFTVRVADTPEPLLEYVGHLNLSPEERIAVTEHRVDPGEEVFVLGRGIDGDGSVPDVANVVDATSPFWLSPGSRREAVRDSGAVGLAAIGGVLVVGVAIATAVLVAT